MRALTVLCCLLAAVTQAAVTRRHVGLPEGVTSRADTDTQPLEGRRGGLNGCLGCRHHRSRSSDAVPEEELIQRYIEKIKQEILSQLGMTAPPNVTIGPVPENIPEPLRHNDEESAGSEDSGGAEDQWEDQRVQDATERPQTRSSKQIIIYGDEVEIHHQNQSTNHILQFSLPAVLPVSNIASVELWLYMDDSPSQHTNCSDPTHHTLSVHSLESNTSSHPHHHPIANQSTVVASLQVRRHSGWFRVRLPESVESTLVTGSGRFAVEHGSCVDVKTGSSHRPFLALRIRRRSQRRRRSNAQRCQDGTANCCRMHSLYINFRDLGWNFILSPPGFETNYCLGSCAVPSVENLVRTRRVHSALLQKVSRIRNNTEFLPCCAATSFSALSLLYRNDNNVDIQENIPNVRVNSCGCS